jgi:hypothetical protein
VVRVSIEVRSGAATFRVAVQAESIERALSLVGGSYPVSNDVRVVFPIDPEGFFVEDVVAPRAGREEFEVSQQNIAARAKDVSQKEDLTCIR